MVFMLVRLLFQQDFELGFGLNETRLSTKMDNCVIPCRNAGRCIPGWRHVCVRPLKDYEYFSARSQMFPVWVGTGHVATKLSSHPDSVFKQEG